MSKKPFILLIAVLLAACSSARSPEAIDDLRSRAASVAQGVGGGLADKKSANMSSTDQPELAKEAAPSATREEAGEYAPAAPPAAKAPAGSAHGAIAGKPAKPAKQNPTAGLYIIRHGNLTLQVNSVKAAQERVSGLVKDVGGFISDSRLDASEGGVPAASLTVRVPATQFDKLLNALGDVGNVRTRQVTGDDVTLEYVDTTSRVRNLQKEEGQLLELLKRAGKLSDVLEVERELSRVRGEIERSQGRLRHLSNQVDLATIEITLTEQVQISTTSPWNLGATLENAIHNAERELAGTLNWLITTGITLVVAVLPIFVLGLLAFLALGWVLRKVLVDHFKLLPARFFGRLWLGVGFVTLAIAFPPLFGLLFAALVVVGLLWAGSALFGRMFKRKGSDLDS
ncbi:MAG: hypothetical protein JWM80_4574 [Cyanobacteria bacterium RYN_339]|nr:hypothetical protein [Cyanobacteria bacterium RYN_339]